jgi:hypothetical protein
MLVYQTIQAVLTKMYSDEAKSFAQFLAFVERYHAADQGNFYNIAYYKETMHFQATFFALAATRQA